MGLDYIRDSAGKAHTKRWAKGVDRLKSPTLFETRLDEVSRTVTITLVPGCKAKAGDNGLLQSNGSGKAAMFDGHRRISAASELPSGIGEVLNASHGAIPVTIERVSAFGNTAEVKLK